MESITKKADQIFSEWDSTVSPGCALAVVKDGEIIYKRGYGMANLEYGVPIRPDTIFHIASISKQFAALAVTLLAREDKLSLEDDIHKYVNEVPDFGEKITIKQLIHHTSGLRDQWEMLVLAGWRMDDVITTQDVLELLSRQKELNFKPGDKHLYCNTGYTLLSVIVERVSGKTLKDFCKERIFKPLGMNKTHFHDDHTLIVPGRAYSYAPAEAGFQKEVLSYATVGATSLFTTVEDLALWDEEFYKGEVLGKDVIKEMHTKGVLNNGEEIDYAYGLSITNYRGLKTVGHSGADAGFRTQLLRFPEQHMSFIVFANLETISPNLLAKKVADIYLEEQFKTSGDNAEEKVIDLPENELEKFSGIYAAQEKTAFLQIKVKDGKLHVVMGNPYALEALGPVKFRVAALPTVKLIFEKIEAGFALQFYMGDKPEKYIQSKVITPAISELKEYCGTYYSPELDVKYVILLKENSLYLKRRKYGENELIPAVKDGFTSSSFYNGDLTFERDEKNQVNAFRSTSGRILNLYFEKIK